MQTKSLRGEHDQARCPKLVTRLNRILEDESTEIEETPFLGLGIGRCTAAPLQILAFSRAKVGTIQSQMTDNSHPIERRMYIADSCVTRGDGGLKARVGRSGLHFTIGVVEGCPQLGARNQVYSL